MFCNFTYYFSMVLSVTSNASIVTYSSVETTLSAISDTKSVASETISEIKP